MKKEGGEVRLCLDTRLLLFTMQFLADLTEHIMSCVPFPLLLFND